MTKNDWIIHWHRRYYGPLTIVSLVNMPGEGKQYAVDEVQKVIYDYEEGLIPTQPKGRKPVRRRVA